MEEQQARSRPDPDLRRRAEGRLLEKGLESPETMSEHEIRVLLHDLQVHQVELEMQNEELQRARHEAEDLKEQYLDLYDFAPVGYFTFDTEGTVLSVNLTGAKLLNLPRSSFVGRRFQFFIDEALRSTFSTHIREIIDTGEKRTFVVRLPAEDGRSPRYIQVEGIAAKSPAGGRRLCRAVVIDVSERLRAEARDRELAQHKMEFYRRTIGAATNGKLVIADTGDVESIAGRPIVSLQIRSREELSYIRHKAEEFAVTAGMDETRVPDFILAIGEAATNALKHAGGGSVSIHRLPDALMIVTSDRGPGITAMNLPDVALREGYSTAGTLGMGYKVMMQVADRVYLATGPEGTTVGIRVCLHQTKGSSLADLTPVTLSTCTDR